MSLRKAQERLEQSEHCRFSIVYESLDKDDRAVISEWIAENRNPNWIARVMRIEGIVLNDKTIRRHLEGVCHCSEDAELRGAYRVSA